jgi:hypothetical protein
MNKFLLSICIIFIISVTINSSVSGVIVNLYPRFSYISPGDTIDISIEIEQIDSISAYEICLDYNETLIEILNIYEGELFKNSEFSTFWSVISSDDSIHVDNSLLGAGNYLDGPGELVKISFCAIGEGFCELPINKARLFRGVDEIDSIRTMNGTISISTVTGVIAHDNIETPISIYPNPIHNSTRISYRIPRNTWCKILIYDCKGKQIRKLTEEYYRKGYYELQWDGTNNYHEKITSGIYFLNIRTEKLDITKKLILLK